MSYERVMTNASSDSRDDVAPPLTPEPDGDATDERALSLGERMRSPRTIASFVIAAIIIVLAFRYLNVNFGDVWEQVRNANPFYLSLAFLAYYGSFPLRATRW